MLNKVITANKWTPFCESAHLPFKASQDIDLYCFPFAGGSASTYMPWINQAHDRLRIKPIELPGRGTRLGENPVSNINDLLDVLERELIIQSHRPFAVFGYSMGGMIAFEWVRRLEKKGGPLPKHLFISASGGQPDNDKHRFRGSLDDATLCEELGRMGGTAQEVLDTPELLEIIIPYIRADFQIVDSFYRQSDMVLRTPITVYAGQDDGEISDRCYKSWLSASKNPMGIKKFPGGHFFIKDNYENVLNDIFFQLSLQITYPEA